MTVKTTPTTKLATPGAVLFVVGVVLMWWGAGVFRKRGTAESGGGDAPIVNPQSLLTPGFGGGSSGNGGGSSGSF